MTLAAQGATKPILYDSDLAFLELTLALARSVNESELEGWKYKGPVQVSVGGSKVKKWGIKTVRRYSRRSREGGRFVGCCGTHRHGLVLSLLQLLNIMLLGVWLWADRVYST